MTFTRPGSADAEREQVGQAARLRRREKTIPALLTRRAVALSYQRKVRSAGRRVAGIALPCMRGS